MAQSPSTRQVLSTIGGLGALLGVGLTVTSLLTDGATLQDFSFLFLVAIGLFTVAMARQID